MPTHFLRTSDVAKAAGVHPNTVRLYEQWGFLPRIPRSPAGYRLFTHDHVDQMRLARTALRGPWPGRAIKRSALDLVRLAAAGDLGGALEQAYRLRTRVDRCLTFASRVASISKTRQSSLKTTGVDSRWPSARTADMDVPFGACPCLC